MSMKLIFLIERAWLENQGQSFAQGPSSSRADPSGRHQREGQVVT